MIILHDMLREVPVDALTSRVVHTYDSHPGPIEGALAEAFGFTEEAQRAMRFGELERIFRAVETLEESSKFHLIVVCSDICNQLYNSTVN